MTRIARMAPEQWLPLRAAHEARVDALIGGHRARTAAGRAHPVLDFLFTYYSFRPAALRRWHPGYGIALDGPQAMPYREYAGYHADGAGATVDPAQLDKRRGMLRLVADLLAATAARPPQLACFGLHEWAMVYRSDDVRHGAVPLRLGSAGTDAVVESMSLRCTHFDAYRFFTPDAAPRNTLPLTRQTQPHTEQPGCLHANMDLYKWCYKLVPLVDSTLLLDCFELAHAARELDMRASPYDLTRYGYTPIPIETPAGRATYARAQATLATQATPLRTTLHSHCHSLLSPQRESLSRPIPTTRDPSDPQAPNRYRDDLPNQTTEPLAIAPQSQPATTNPALIAAEDLVEGSGPKNQT